MASTFGLLQAFFGGKVQGVGGCTPKEWVGNTGDFCSVWLWGSH